ncbi:MAG: hypothetical protein KC444_06970 [Nitrosopumilus sp.]|nr:hypothetical protein [Nitrosopumilus sp.]
MFKFEQNPAEKTDYIIGSTWSSLTKTWKKYNQAKEDMNIMLMRQYSKKIQNLQKKLGLEESHFEELSDYPDNTLFR